MKFLSLQLSYELAKETKFRTMKMLLRIIYSFHLGSTAELFLYCENIQITSKAEIKESGKPLSIFMRNVPECASTDREKVVEGFVNKFCGFDFNLLRSLSSLFRSSNK